MTLDVNSADNFYMNGHAVDKIFFHGVEIWPNYVNNKNTWFYITPVASSGDLDINLSSGSSIEYSKDTVNWITDTNTITTVPVLAGEKVYFRNTIGTTTNGFSLNPDFNYSVGGNLSSLYYGSSFNGQIITNYGDTGPTITNGRAHYSSLFANSTNLIFAHNLIIPFTRYESEYGHVEYRYPICISMFEGCTNLRTPPNITIITSENRPSDATERDYVLGFGSMFKNCTSLQYVPIFPTNFDNLGWYYLDYENTCLQHMFEGCESLTSTLDFEGTYAPEAAFMYKNCTSLQTAPQIPFPSLGSGVYGYGRCESMFEGCTSLTSAPELPATSLSIACYQNMFKNCTSLRRAPSILPATTLARNCYEEMFRGCTSLTNTPILPATNLSYCNACYCAMFTGCTSLTTAPELPATTLAYNCYEYMFGGCTSLVNVPSILPATTIPGNDFLEVGCCYRQMFRGCTSLTTAPELPAATLTYKCYEYMFDGCTSLNYIKCLAIDKSATDCINDWTSGVSQTGTFVKQSNSYWPTGVDGIPSGWTTLNA